MQNGVDSQRAVENKRVFVVDDNEVSSMALQFMLHDEYETHELPDVAAALAKGREFLPDLILLGEGIVASEGSDVVSRFKTRCAGVKILIVCDDADDAPVRDALARGADGVLTRPLKLETVRRRVDTQLGRRAAIAIPVVQS